MVEFTDATGEVLAAGVDRTSGSFRARLPEGTYTVRAGRQRTSLTVLPGGSYPVDLRPGHVLEFRMTAETTTDGEVAIRLTAGGGGSHSFALRTENLAGDLSPRQVTMRQGNQETIVWKARKRSAGQPWVVVIVPDGDISGARDLVEPAPRN